MKTIEFPMSGGRHGVGQAIVKIVATSTLVRWRSFDPVTREYEVELADGILRIHETAITKNITTQEELDFLNSEQNAK